MLSFRNTGCSADHISKLGVKFNENHWRITNNIIQESTNKNRNLRLSKIRFLYPVVFTTEYNIDVIFHMEFFADPLKDVMTRAQILSKLQSVYKIGCLLLVFSENQTWIGPQFSAPCKIWCNLVKNSGRLLSTQM